MTLAMGVEDTGQWKTPVSCITGDCFVQCENLNGRPRSAKKRNGIIIIIIIIIIIKIIKM